MSQIKKLLHDEVVTRILKFRDDREWKQFHNPKDMVLSLMIEAAELAEHVQWKSAEEFLVYAKSHRLEIGDELADIFYWVLLIAHDLDLDIIESFKQKMVKNENKYPVPMARGNKDKYKEYI